MAGISTDIWEFRATAGSANAGGGFDTASGGTDYSNQDAAQLQLTDLATSGIGVTTLTSATGGFTAAMVGNYIQIRSGTNVTAGWYRVTVRTDTNTVTLDRAPDDGVGGISGGSGDLGGALDVLTEAFIDDADTVVAGNKIYIKDDGTMTLTGNIIISENGTSVNPITIEGYSTTRGDNPTGANRPNIAAGANFFLLDGDYYIAKNLDITGTATVVFRVGIGGIIENTKCQNTSASADRVAFGTTGGKSRPRFIGCEGISDNGRALEVNTSSRVTVIAGYFHDSKDGIFLKNGLSVFVGVVVDTCTNGFNSVAENEVTLVNIVIYNCTVAILETTGLQWTVVNLITDANTDGAKWTTEQKSNYFDYNCWDNTTDVTQVTKGDHSVTGDPGLTDPANGDFTLGSGSNCLDAGMQIGTNQGAVGDYKVNIGADQDDVAAGGGTTSILGAGDLRGGFA